MKHDAALIHDLSVTFSRSSNSNEHIPADAYRRMYPGRKKKSSSPPHNDMKMDPRKLKSEWHRWILRPNVKRDDYGLTSMCDKCMVDYMCIRVKGVLTDENFNMSMTHTIAG